MPVNSAVQLACSVFRTGAFFQEELARLGGNLQRKRAITQARVDVILQIGDLLVENCRKRFGRQRLVGDDAIDAVDELGRETLADGDQGNALQLAGQVRPICAFHGLEAEFGIDLAHHLPRSQVTRKKHKASFEINRGVVAQP